MMLVPAATSPARHGTARVGPALALLTAAMLTSCASMGCNRWRAPGRSAEGGHLSRQEIDSKFSSSPRCSGTLSLAFSAALSDPVAITARKRRSPMLIVDAQIHLWEKGTPSAHHRQEPYSAEQAIAGMDEAGVGPGADSPGAVGPRLERAGARSGGQIPRPVCYHGLVLSRRP